MEGELSPPRQEPLQDETGQTAEIEAAEGGPKGPTHHAPVANDHTEEAALGASPSRLAALTRKIVNLVSSPLRSSPSALAPDAGTSVTVQGQPPGMEVMVIGSP